MPLSRRRDLCGTQNDKKGGFPLGSHCREGKKGLKLQKRVAQGDARRLDSNRSLKA